jgi:hypothetical protein
LFDVPDDVGAKEASTHRDDPAPTKSSKVKRKPKGKKKSDKKTDKEADSTRQAAY